MIVTTSFKIYKMKKGLIFIVFLIVSVQNIVAQNNKLDSLKQVINSNMHDTLKLRAYADIVNHLKYQHYDTVRPYFKTGLALAESNKSDFTKANLYQNFAISFAVNNLYDTSLIYFEKAKDYYEKTNKQLHLSKVYSNIAGVYRLKGFYKLSIEYNFKSLKIRETLTDTLSIAKAYNDLASAYSYAEEYDNALKYAKKALIIFENSEISNDKIVNLIALSDIYEKKEDFDSALFYAELSEKLCLHNKQITARTYNLAHIYNNLATIVRGKSKFNESIEYSFKSIAYFDTLQSHISSKFYAYENLAECYRFLKDYKQAQYYLELAEKSIENCELIEEEKYLALEKSIFYIAKNDYFNAFKNYEKYKLLEDSIMTIKNKNAIAEYQIIYDTEKKELENQKLLTQNAQKQATIFKLIFLIIALVFIFVAIIYLINYYTKKREGNLILKIQEEEKQRNYDFFHKTGNQLMNIYTLKNMNNEIEPEKIVGKIGEEMRFFSHSQFSPSFDKTTLNELLAEIIVDYQKFINAKIVYNNFISPSNTKKLKKSILSILYNIIQELLQNAVKHSQASLIEIDIMQEKKNLNIVYKDNGKGTNIENLHGTGLKYITKFANMNKGKVEIKTQPLNGFSCFVTLHI